MVDQPHAGGPPTWYPDLSPPVAIYHPTHQTPAVAGGASKYRTWKIQRQCMVLFQSHISSVKRWTVAEPESRKVDIRINHHLSPEDLVHAASL